ncbi:MAG: universal stress protein [Leptolyngbyaceae cyanobacterium SL_7_1]|nr:universal stress protein [Leptolyngbyaceae cyanobacterium SL_7_1]
MFQSALICTDFSDGLQRLAGFVSSLAAGGLQRLIFLHTIPISNEREIPRVDESKIQAVRDRFQASFSNLPAGVTVEIDVQYARVVDHILNASKTHKPDVTLLGRSNRNQLDERVFGSTLLELCRRITNPVLMLRPQLISAYTDEELDLRCRHLFRYLMIPYDGSDSANYLVSQIKQGAQRQSDKSLECVFLCWVVDNSGRRELRATAEQQQATEKLAAVKADLETTGLQVATEIRLGEPIIELLASAVERDITAIAAASGTMGTLLSWSIPSLTNEILHRSWHPVLFFPPARS